jgi:hypothetical protein
MELALMLYVDNLSLYSLYFFIFFSTHYNNLNSSQSEGGVYQDPCNLFWLDPNGKKT